MRWICFVYFAVAAVAFFPDGVRAQTEGLGVAARLPIEVSEVVTGGTWIDGQASGWYRCVTIQTYAPVEVAEVYLQWIGSRLPSEPLQIMSSVPLREFNEQKLASASITLEADAQPGIAKIIVAGQDAAGRAVNLLSFVATMPGRYEVIPPETVTVK